MNRSCGSRGALWLCCSRPRLVPISADQRSKSSGPALKCNRLKGFGHDVSLSQVTWECVKASSASSLCLGERKHPARSNTSIAPVFCFSGRLPNLFLLLAHLEKDTISTTDRRAPGMTPRAPGPASHAGLRVHSLAHHTPEVLQLECASVTWQVC